MRILLDEAEYLASEGHDVAIVTTHPHSAPETTVSQSNHSTFSLPGRVNPFRPQLSYLKRRSRPILDEFFQSWKPDVVHSHDICSLSHIAQSIAREQGIPFVAHHHFSKEFVLRSLPGFVSGGGGGLFTWQVVRRIACRYYNRCTSVIACTPESQRDLVAWGVSTPVRIVPNGVQLARFSGGDKVADRRRANEFLGLNGADERKPIVLYAGRMDADKNIDTLLKAIPVVLSRSPAIFVFAGDGNQKARIEALSKSAAWGASVRYAGYIEHSDEIFPTLFRASDIAWTASPIEVQSLVLLEAMASGLPIVQARHRALASLVEDGRNGCWVDTFDPEAYAQAISGLLEDDTLRAAYGCESHERARNYDIVETHRLMESIHDELYQDANRVFSAGPPAGNVVPPQCHCERSEAIPNYEAPIMRE